MKKNDFSRASQYYDLILGTAKFEKSASFVAKVLKKHNIKTVLELGCGTGLYLLPLSKKFEIEGLDISNEMLKIARKKNKKIKLYKKDMSSFQISKKYDAMLCLNSSLVLLPNMSLIKKTLQNCANHLNQGGILIVDLPNHSKEIKESNFSQEYEHYKIPKGYIDVLFRDHKRGNKWVSDWFGLVKKGKRFSTFREHYEELIYSPTELEKMIRKNGFRIINKYGSRVGGKFTKDSYRRFYVCKKTNNPTKT